MPDSTDDSMRNACQHCGTYHDGSCFFPTIDDQAVKAEVTPTCTDFKPDHNGECLNCDDWAGAHDLPSLVDKMDKKFLGPITKAKDGSVVPEDEWICFLVKDNAFAAVLPQYLAACLRLGADAAQIEAVTAMVRRAFAWREQHPERCKVPDAHGERLLP